MQSHFVLWSSELCCSLLFTQWCFLLQLFSEDWKTPLNGILWVVHSNYPLLAKLLIEGIRSRAAPPSPGCDRRTGSSAAKSRASDSESCFCHVRLWGFKCTAALACVCACAHEREREREQRPWLRVSTSTATANLGLFRQFRCPGNQLQGGVCISVSWVLSDTGRGNQITAEPPMVRGRVSVLAVSNPLGEKKKFF